MTVGELKKELEGINEETYIHVSIPGGGYGSLDEIEKDGHDIDKYSSIVFIVGNYA